MHNSKFKFWDKTKRNWLFSDITLGSWSIKDIMLLLSFTNRLKNFNRLGDISILEYTKTVDRFNAELFEGDIIQPLRDIGRGWGKGLNFTIIYDEVHNRWGANWKGHGKGTSAFFITRANTKNVKKVGNIFENLDLIK